MNIYIYIYRSLEKAKKRKKKIESVYFLICNYFVVYGYILLYIVYVYMQFYTIYKRSKKTERYSL